ncbi:sulfotransferase [Nocardioidaceae bacterium SCSIO 66511]|nr:sulfotransferase [Nocardioidaceae bacterium SCSIO 66511]
MASSAGDDGGEPRARYVLHCGLPKTGTSFVQSILTENRPLLRRGGVLYPRFGKRGRLLAALDARDRHRYAGRDQPAEGHWKRFVAATRSFDGTVVFSHEVMGAPLSRTTPTALAELAEHRTDIVITARDPARQLMSVWQQSLRFRSPLTFDEFLAECDFRADGAYRHGHFRDHQLDRVLRAWAEHVPADRIHLVVVPQPTSPRALLWERFCTALGVEPAQYEIPVEPQSNHSLGVVQAELLRRVNAAMGDRVTSADYSVIRKFVIGNVLARTEPSPKPVLPQHAHNIADELADRWIDAVHAGGYNIIGKPEDLRPVVTTGPGPDDWTDSAVAAAGVTAGAEVLIAYARARGRT